MVGRSAIPNGNQIDMTVFEKKIDAGAVAMREVRKTVTPFGRPNPPLASEDWSFVRNWPMRMTAIGQ